MKMDRNCREIDLNRGREILRERESEREREREMH